jgi:hypothetical protein
MLFTACVSASSQRKMFQHKHSHLPPKHNYAAAGSMVRGCVVGAARGASNTSWLKGLDNGCECTAVWCVGYLRVGDGVNR